VSKRVAIVQSSYVPWKGFFDLIRSVDEFILLDEVQFTRRDWRSRNRIKTQHGVAWLTVPVQTKGRYHQSIEETVVADGRWAARHWATLGAAYARAPFFDDYAEDIARLYEGRRPEERLSEVNHAFIVALCELTGINTPISWSSAYGAREGRNERLVDLCRSAGGTDYLSGPSARDYLDETQFAEAGIRVQFADYSGYPEYPQVHPPFEHGVSMLDLLFCAVPVAVRYLKRL
jgi:hypothetical protein